MSRIGVGLLAYNSENFIRQSAGCLQPFVDKVVVRVDDKTTDDTRRILDGMWIEHRDFTWKHNYAYAKNLLVDDLADCDWIIILDDDEKYTPGGGQRLVTFVRSLEGSNVDGLEIPMQQCFPKWELNEENYLKEFGIGNAHLSVFRKGYHFVNKVHESIPVPENRRIKSQYFIDHDIIIAHYAWKGDRAKYEAGHHQYYLDLSAGKTIEPGKKYW